MTHEALIMETTYIMIKPDGVQRGLVGTIIDRFERKGLHLVGLKSMVPDEATARSHYAVRRPPLLRGSDPIHHQRTDVAMAWTGKDAIAVARTSSDPPTAGKRPRDVRGDFGMDIGYNMIHGSDARRVHPELALWFPEGLMDWTSARTTWVYES